MLKGGLVLEKNNSMQSQVSKNYSKKTQENKKKYQIFVSLVFFLYLCGLL